MCLYTVVCVVRANSVFVDSVQYGNRGLDAKKIKMKTQRECLGSFCGSSSTVFDHYETKQTFESMAGVNSSTQPQQRRAANFPGQVRNQETAAPQGSNLTKAMGGVKT